MPEPLSQRFSSCSDRSGERHLSVRGSDDDFRGHLCLGLPWDSRRSCVGSLLDAPTPEPNGHVAKLSKPAALGRLRGIDLFHRVLDFLVHRFDSNLATLRDRAKNKISYWAYGLFAIGWRGAASHWNNYERAYLLFAALATPLVLSVHSVVLLTLQPR